MNISRIKELANKYPLLKVALYPAIMMRRPIVNMKAAWKHEVIENLGELLINDPVVRIDEFKGIFTIDVRSDLFARVIMNREYEPKFIHYCLDYMDKDKDVIDVGANVGFYSVLFAKNLGKGRVIAVEPTQNALKNLKKNLALNEVGAKVEVFEGVVSDRMGELEIKTIAGKEEYSSIGVLEQPPTTGLKFHTEKVVSTTIDELVKQTGINPGFIKIDVEGAEHMVINGALKVLQENRPIVFSEISDFSPEKERIFSKRRDQHNQEIQLRCNRRRQSVGTSY